MLVADDGGRLGSLFDRPLVMVSRLWVHMDFGPVMGLAAFPLWQLDLPGRRGMVLGARELFHVVACVGDVVSGTKLGKLVAQARLQDLQ